MTTYVVSGTASRIGAATRARLERDGHMVVGVDLLDADVVADVTQSRRHIATCGPISGSTHVSPRVCRQCRS